MIVNSIGIFKATFPDFQSTFSNFEMSTRALPVPIAMGVKKKFGSNFEVTVLVISANFSSHSSNAFFEKGRDDS